MVAAVSHHDAHFIQWRMPVAQGLQYQAIWHDLHDQPTEAPLTSAPRQTFASLAG